MADEIEKTEQQAEAVAPPEAQPVADEQLDDVSGGFNLLFQGAELAMDAAHVVAKHLPRVI